MKTGIVTKGIGGFYYVDCDNEILTCRAAGAIKSKQLKLAVGDKVEVENEGHGDYLITSILPRKNLIFRPYSANVDLGVIVCAIKHPQINYPLLDKLIIDNALKGIETLLCITKLDLATENEKESIRLNYENVVKELIFTSTFTNTGINEMKEALNNNVCLFRGVSGAGKTSLLNAISPGIKRETGTLSKKIERGKNTTRHSELTKIDENTFILDSPGFSDFDVPLKEETDLWKFYPEFFEYSDCHYPNCVHINEPDCEVKKALAEEKISKLRYENYLKIYNEIKQKKKY